MDANIQDISGSGYKRQVQLRDLHDVKRQLRGAKLHSVCEEAKCPNRGECFGRGVATFLIGGDVCTRGCRFCSIKTGKPLALDPNEPENLALTAERLGLKHVVVTAVNRDDLPDGGAGHFAAVIHALRRRLQGVAIEVLIPDFKGNLAAVATVAEAEPDVFNHNVETVPRLYKKVRPGAEYQRSLDVLAFAAKLMPNNIVKSGLMVGHGETWDELRSVLKDLSVHGVNAVTIGQYFQPTGDQLDVVEYWSDAAFSQVQAEAEALGIARAWAGRYVRSSYLADRFLEIKPEPILPGFHHAS